MKKHLRISRRAALFAALLLVVFTVSACGGTRIEAAWGNLSVTPDQSQIVFAYYDRVVKLDPVSGRLVQLMDSDGNVRLDDAGNPRTWEFRAPDGNAQTQFYTAPLHLNDDTFLIASYSGKLFEVENATARYEASSGVTLGGQVVANPVIANDRLYVPYSQANIEAFTVDGLHPAWTFKTEHGIFSQPLVTDGGLYVSALDHFVYSLDPVTGEELWRVDLGGAVTSAPALGNDALYAGSFANKLYKIGLDGEILGSVDASNWVWGTPAVDGDMVYFGDVSGNMYAARDTGSSFELVWGPLPIARNAIVATPLLSGDTLIVGSRDHSLYWVNQADGAVIQTRETQGEILGNLLLLTPETTPALSQPVVVVSTMAAEELVIAFTLDTGERLWAYKR